MSLEETLLKKYAQDLPGVKWEKVATDFKSTKGDLKRLEHYISLRIEEHPDYSRLAARILYHRIRDQCQCKSFDELVRKMEETGKAHPTFLKRYYRVRNQVEGWLVHKRDDLFDYFGMRMLYDKYLIRYPTHKSPCWETPQFMWMRIAIAIYGENPFWVRRAYEALSQLKYTHATPALMNAGWNPSQYSSCFLFSVEDSISGIFEGLKTGGRLSKSGGGCGASLTAIRPKGSVIYGSGGVSEGLQPVMELFEKTFGYVNQGGGKRKGGLACYLEPWHGEIENFLACKAESRERGQLNFRNNPHFNIALWIPDLFMKRMLAGGKWSLFDSSLYPGLMDSWGKEFEQLYERLEAEKRYMKQMDAMKLWEKILTVIIEAGMPYVLFKDACNRYSNQKYLGTITNSNLCAEVVQYNERNADEKNALTAVCNLASVCLQKFVLPNGHYDFDALRETVYMAIRGLDAVIDINHYAVESARRTNLLYRPVGLGIQGLADVFAMLRLPFDSAEAKLLNKRIAEHIYYAAVSSSIDLARETTERYVDEHGQWKMSALNQLMDREKNPERWPIHNRKTPKYAGAYEGFLESPAGHGKLAPNLHGWDPVKESKEEALNWEQLYIRLKRYGMRNSQLTVCMPTASTSQLCGSFECFEPPTWPIFVRDVSNGRFTVINRYMVKELEEMGLWDEEMRQDLLRCNGTIQEIERIPKEIRLRYKSAYELSQRTLIDMATDRGIFIDGSQSRNLYLKGPVSRSRLHSCLVHSWKNGDKTGLYYLRTDVAAKPIGFGLNQKDAPKSCPLSPSTDHCESCSA